MLRELAVAAGARGMCGGQALDIDATGNGAAISRRRAATPACAEDRRADARSGAPGRARRRRRCRDAATLDTFADALGLAFQIRDDLLDVEGDSATLGKTAGKDAAQAKATFPALLGMEGVARTPARTGRDMRDALAPFAGPRAALL